MYPIVNVFGLVLPSYGIMMTLGCAASVIIALKRCARFSCSKDNATIIMACAGGLAMLGAHLLYLAVTFSPGELLELLTSGDAIAAVGGGQVFYGGVMGGALGALLGFKVAGVQMKNAGPYILAILPAVPLGHALGRVGCFFAGCCYGVPYNGPGAAIYRRPIGGAPAGIPLFPVQLVEALLDVVIFIMLDKISKKSLSATVLAAAYMLLYAVMRFSLEFLRYDSARGAALGLSTSQWISAALFSTGLALVFLTRNKQKLNN